ncbi:MAG: 50S ribosomal protein L9 [Candidatus Yanofskybacteria bacterium RIFCSPLOWO2_01_FULL_41_34]|uniref:Large ribosomal subunit protein bL9 n=1 Tax=Candidatus Yanofskybacteria bacterium RIFCSPHIGHO2_01_FULL_41_26 TaxID=1802661 RepID=A0A1F8ECD4_9BACT|nr:MAG: 50S ribosomal protein L9 [Candidatus Yanofskybacteria bacterium RIFCSPHIGHO2_01_FULL_41_26]OGN22989.1 MAG: 50S ribosomal protein L9 [Candidatus Yanofskybacteria bacterium RIFCSPLOWO2_01_FULL_41_34]
MKVILLQNIKGFGQIGDVKNVSDGYGRNFLLPRKMAKAANESSMKEVESLKEKRIIMIETEKKNALEAVEKLKDLVIEFTRKSTKTGKLFAGIGKDDIVAEIKKASGVQLQEEMIGHDEPIKHVGEHLVDLNLSLEVKTQIKVLVKTE